MKVSIVTISYNQAAFLERAIRSVVEQTHDDIEYIVVDPGSSDGSRDIIARYRDRIALAIFERDAGPVDGLNRGFARATGAICGYINADDAFLPDAVAKAVAAFRAHPSADLVYGHGSYVDENDRVLRRFRSSPFSLRGCAHGTVSIMQQATFFRRDALVATGGFNLENRTCWDLELCIDLALQGRRLARINDDLGLFRVHGASISGSGRLDELYRRDLARMARKITGHEPGSWRRLGRAATRIEKWLRDPLGLALRVTDALAGRTVFDRPLPRL